MSLQHIEHALDGLSCVTKVMDWGAGGSYVLPFGLTFC